MRLLCWLFVCAGLASSCAGSVRADVTAKDLQLLGRALTNLDPPASGAVNFAIVYAPDNPDSGKEADDIKKLLGDGLAVGAVTIKPLMVKVNDTVSVADVAGYLMTKGTGPVSAKMNALFKASKKPCVTFDVDQVRGGSCVLSVRSAPAVEIYVSKAAAAANGVSFTGAFLMLIKEL